MNGLDLDVPQSVLNEIAAMDSDDFRKLVDRDIRDDVELDVLLSFALRTPQFTDRWYYTLVRMKKSTELTIAAKKADDKERRMELLERAEKARTPEQRKQLLMRADNERRKYLAWFAGATRFNTGVELKLIEAQYYRRSYSTNMYPRQIAEERDNLSEMVRSLSDTIETLRERLDRYEAAIEEHRQALDGTPTVGLFGRIVKSSDGDGKGPDPTNERLWSVLSDGH